MINLQKEILEQPSVLSKLENVNKQIFDSLIKELKEKKIDNIYLVARGTSDHACIYAQYLFEIVMGIPCCLGTPSVITKYKKDVIFHNSLVIGVSQSGKAEDVFEVLKSAKKQGITTLSITNNPDSIVAKIADYHLFCNAGEEKSIAATKTFTSQIYLLAMLCAKWSNNKKLAESLLLVPSHVQKLFEYIPNQINEIIDSVKERNEIVVLGRGIEYPIALEGALKMLETNGLKVKGYTISDFYHGYIAQLKKGDLVILLAQKGAVYDDSVAMLKKLQTIGTDTIVLTDNKDFISKNKYTVYIDDTGNELTSAFLFVVSMQILACKLAISNGIDPDKSKVISKITITK